MELGWLGIKLINNKKKMSKMKTKVFLFLNLKSKKTVMIAIQKVIMLMSKKAAEVKMRI